MTTCSVLDSFKGLHLVSGCLVVPHAATIPRMRLLPIKYYTVQDRYVVAPASKADALKQGLLRTAHPLVVISWPESHAFINPFMASITMSSPATAVTWLELFCNACDLATAQKLSCYIRWFVMSSKTLRSGNGTRRRFPFGAIDWLSG